MSPSNLHPYLLCLGTPHPPSAKARIIADAEFVHFGVQGNAGLRRTSSVMEPHSFKRYELKGVIFSCDACASERKYGGGATA